MDAKDHWQNIYRTKDSKQVSWYTDHVASSLDRIESLELRLDAEILDLGGGASTLVDDLLNAGYSGVSVMDISSVALNIVRHRLGAAASRLRWIEGDVLTTISTPRASNCGMIGPCSTS